MNIKVEHKNVGNSLRGYHNTETTITFEYPAGPNGPDGWQLKERELEIVEFLTKNGIWMWWDLLSQEEFHGEFPNRYNANQMNTLKVGAKYVVRHGYDSGD